MPPRDMDPILHQRSAKEALRLEELRHSITQGVEALDRGDYTDIDDEALGTFLGELV